MTGYNLLYLWQGFAILIRLFKNKPDLTLFFVKKNPYPINQSQLDGEYRSKENRVIRFRVLETQPGPYIRIWYSRWSEKSSQLVGSRFRIRCSKYLNTDPKLSKNRFRVRSSRKPDPPNKIGSGSDSFEHSGADTLHSQFAGEYRRISDLDIQEKKNRIL